jgi:hypothetical protein
MQEAGQETYSTVKWAIAGQEDRTLIKNMTMCTLLDFKIVMDYCMPPISLYFFFFEKENL